jgi:hypothetical protein
MSPRFPRSARALGALCLPVVAALLAQPLVAQFTVGPPGSGAPFEQISDAVAAVAPNATILVAGGEYGPFLVDKPLTIVGTGSGPGPVGSVIVHPDPGGGLPAIRVASIAAGGVVRLAGLGVATAVATPFARIRLESSAGLILLVDVAARGTDFSASGSSSDASLVIDGCDAVVLESCAVFGVTAPAGQALLNGTAGARIVDSAVWINGGDLRGAGGGSQFFNGGLGAPGLRATDSVVKLSRTAIVGGGGGVVWHFDPLLTYGFAGAQGVDLLRSELVVAGGEGNGIVGGYGPAIDEEVWHPGGPAVRVNADSTLRIAADATRAPGEDGNGGASTQAVVQAGAGATVLLEALPRPPLGIVPATPRPGDALTFRFGGTPGAVPAVWLSPDPAGPAALAVGDLLLDPGQLFFLGTVVLDGTGQGVLGATVPTDVGLLGLGIVCQSATVAPGPSLRLSNPAALFVTP